MKIPMEQNRMNLASIMQKHNERLKFEERLKGRVLGTDCHDNWDLGERDPTKFFIYLKKIKFRYNLPIVHKCF